jgi:hypothetical protein
MGRHDQGLNLCVRVPHWKGKEAPQRILSNVIMQQECHFGRITLPFFGGRRNSQIKSRKTNAEPTEMITFVFYFLPE